MENKLKIIHIAQSVGGVTEYIKNFLKNVDQNKYENILILSNEHEEQEALLKDYASKIIYLDVVREINIPKDLKAIKEIRRIVTKEKPDIVYLHSSKAGGLGRLALLFTDDKIIYNAHGWYFNADIGKVKKVFYKMIEKILAFRTQKIIAISKSEYESALQMKICKEDKLVLIENGIETSRYEKEDEKKSIIRKELRIPEDAILVGIVGRISEQKDPMTSIKAAAQAIKKYPKMYFIFVGKGELEDKVLQYAREQGIEQNIIITGWVTDTKPYIEMLDIAVMPSKWEGFGLAIAEYMMCKKPIIATNVGGIGDILNKTNSAFFMKKESPEDMVYGIEYVMSHPKEMKELTEQNYIECKDRFSIQKEIKAHEEVFEELTQKGEGNGKDNKRWCKNKSIAL